ncbi:hypothetical protein FB45DRAFT_59937 [Roridomyces roridus]|uniref:Uncharacterized protein n=1 Tax=Roridomyces roridus TaxID=1738132 RepID=A0AAD7FLV4_9AGAR|nr:hypothetical protein FB45DRAFT_59937 [Roridomyces roridus]
MIHPCRLRLPLLIFSTWSSIDPIQQLESRSGHLVFKLKSLSGLLEAPHIQGLAAPLYVHWNFFLAARTIWDRPR